jgi:chromosome segregation ATPase
MTIEELEAKLEVVTRERDKAHDKLASYRKASDEVLGNVVMKLDAARKERDEARAEVERLTADRDDARDDATKGWDRAEALRKASDEAYRRGAEAMRDACAVLVSNEKRLWLRSELIADLRALPISEEP